MQFITIKEASKKWGISERRLTMLCRNQRIFNAKKVGKSWMVPINTEKPLDGRTKEGSKENKILIDTNFDKEIPQSGGLRVVAAFKRKYHKAPISTSFTPYRICPLGAHTDHNLGIMTGFAIDKGIYMAYGKKMNGIIEISSLQFPKRAQWYVGSTPTKKQGDWADHLRGATIELNKRYQLRVGLCAVFDGELPIGGLSSSAAVIITFLNVLSALNNIKLSDKELIEISKAAENNYVGVACGKLDQSCELYCRKDSLLFMDMLTDTHEVIPVNKKMKPFKIVIFFSGIERSLASSQYNARVDELRCAAYALKAFGSIEYGKLADTNMRDVSYDIYQKFGTLLPLNWNLRAEHWFNEIRRVEKGVEAWRNGDIETFGKLVFESGWSSIKKWETGSSQLIRLYQIMAATKGIYGGRFSGAGFKGCCMAIINPLYEKQILERVEREYLIDFPELSGKFSSHVCETADGVSRINRVI